MAHLRALVVGALLPGVLTAQGFAPRLYETTTETGLPHLEENLRYATTRETRCLGHEQLASAFPILRHEALKGCRLDNGRRAGDALSFVLSCEGGSETRGEATWLLDGLGIRGTLEVKLGGKNMTFYQRIAGRPVGPCVPGD